MEKRGQTERANCALPAALGVPASAHVDAAALGHAPAIGRFQTFHDLLTLDTSVLNRGRDARQFTVSAQAALVDESKHPAIPLEGAKPARADRSSPSESAETHPRDHRKTAGTAKTVIPGLTRPRTTLIP